MEDYKEAHKHCIRHRDEILGSKVCGCFYCLETFPPSEIHEWTDFSGDGIGQTAICPKCGIDAVIGDKSGYPVTWAFLEKMQAYWF